MTGTQLQRVTLRQPSAEVSTVGWHAEPDLHYADWLRHGSRLGLTGRNAGWWVGDWLKYGTAHYGSKYAAAAKVTGYDRQTLMNYVYVASRFEISRRRENLSWSHHAELAARDEAEQDEWLDRASDERLSVRDLREALSVDSTQQRAMAAGSSHDRSASPAKPRSQRGSARSSAERSASTERTVTCPHCGESFAI